MSFDHQCRNDEVLGAQEKTPRRRISTFLSFSRSAGPVRAPAQRDVTLQLRAFPDGAVLARRLTEAVLELWGWPGDRDAALLVMDELFSNAVAATPEGPVWAGIMWEDDGVKLQVWDQSPLLPTSPSLPDADEEAGRGNYLIQALTIRYGTTPIELSENGGKVVWAVCPTFSPEPLEAS